LLEEKAMKISLRILKMAGHAAALVFTAFWLVATSSDQKPVPARDCFTGIPTPVVLNVVLGAPAPPANGGTTPPSCQAIDGLAPGVSIVFGLSQGPRPQVTTNTCYGYNTDSIVGPTDVTLGMPAPPLQSFSLTVADGEFSSSQLSGCRGSWSMSLRPGASPTGLISPLDASATNQWYVGRTIDLDDGQSCGALFSGTGPVLCQDTFPVISITQVSP